MLAPCSPFVEKESRRNISSRLPFYFVKSFAFHYALNNLTQFVNSSAVHGGDGKECNLISAGDLRSDLLHSHFQLIVGQLIGLSQHYCKGQLAVDKKIKHS